MLLATNPVKTSKLGHPVMLGEAVLRIVGHAENSSSMMEGDERQYSILRIATPHGSIIESGRFYIDEITPEGLAKLEAYEEELRYEFKPLYNGLLDDILPKDTETYAAKLRNALNPLYGLSQMIILAEEHPDKDMKHLILEAAKQAEKNKDRVDKLLSLIDGQKT